MGIVFGSEITGGPLKTSQFQEVNLQLGGLTNMSSPFEEQTKGLSHKGPRENTGLVLLGAGGEVDFFLHICI